MPKIKILNIKMPEDMFLRMKAEAEKKSISASAFLRLLLLDYFAKQDEAEK